MDTVVPAPDLARFTGRGHDAHRAFWRDLLAGIEEPIAFPAAGATPAPAFHAVPFSAEASATLARISGGAESARLVVLLAALARVLAAEGSGSCILVDVPPLPTLPDGGEVLPINLPLLRQGSVRDLLAATRDRLSAGFAHQDFPVRRLAAPSLAEAPFLVGSDALHGDGPDHAGAIIRLGAEGLRVRHPDAASLALRIDRALAGFADTARDLASVDLLTQAERDAVAAAGEGPPGYAPATIWQLFVAAAERHPRRIALRAGEATLSYAELRQRAEALAGGLRGQHGVGPGAIVGLVPARNASWIAGLLGIMAAGAAYLPIVADQPAARRDALLAQAAPALLLTAGPAVPGALPVDGVAASFDAAGPSPDDLAYVLYTSGSTGEPKGVMIAHAGFASMIRHQIAVFGVTPEDRVLQLAAASFDASLSEIFMALLAGAALVLIDDADVADTARFTEFLAREDVTVATITPPHLAAFDRHPLPTLRVLIMAGDVADPAAARFYAADRAVFNAYGPTEVSVCASIHRVDAAAPDGPVPIGRAVAGSRIHVLDAFGSPRPPGMAGEIVFEGPGVSPGYLGRESDAFVAAPGRDARAYRTGDAGTFLPDGNLAYLGRIDQQVKLRGHRVEPAEVAQALRAHPLVRDAHVAPLRAPGGQTELAAYVVLRDAVELWPSIAEFFVYDDLAYGAMAGDETRNAAYRAAFARHLPGRVVLEVGPGAEAVLSRMAIAAGARRVYAVEINPAVANQARARLRREGLEDRVEVITGDIMTVTLPEKADVCISEIVGAIGGAEGSAILIEATKRWLKDPAAQIPARSLTRIAGVSLDGLGDGLGFPEAAAAYAERIFAQEGRRFDLRLCLKNLPLDRIVTGADVLEDLDYRATLVPEARHDIRLPVTTEGRIDALLAWLHLVVDAGHPDEAVDILHSRGSWLPVVLPLNAPSPPLRPGDEVVAVVTRRPCANGLNPDFRIEGSFRRDGMEIGGFLCEAPHVAPGFRASPLHAAAFDAAGAPRRAATPAAQLRTHLEGLLPGWMMPSHILPLDRLPLNASGKVDRKALPEPVRAGVAPAAAANALEATIAGIIAEVLGLGAGGIGTGDDFFALGGDSIRAIQVAARLGAMGITLGSTDILSARTVAAMAPLAREKRVRLGGPVAGPFPSTPIQAWFLHRHGAAPNHFNQSMLLRAADRLDPAVIAPALDAVAAHHDALRSRFTRHEGDWRAEVLPNEAPTTVPVIEATTATLEACCAALQASLDLSAGPVWRAAILRLTDGDRLLWVMHHLAVDWVSWRILLQDLDAAVAALQAGTTPALPPPSDGFADWARMLAEGATAPEWAEDAAWWQRDAALATVTLPMAEGADAAGAARLISARLDATATEALLGPACRRHDADMQDLLVAGLAAAARPLAGAGRLRVVVEGHGRDSLLAPLDCSRTVGWFTSFHPVAVPLPEDGAPPVAAVRAALREVPRRGLGYLMQATRPGGVTIPAQIGVNYLGRMEEAPAPDGAPAPFRLADEPAGPAIDPAAPRPLPIEILAQVAEGCLHLALTFTPARVPEATMRGLLDDMLAALARLAAESGGTPGLAADTSLAGLGAGQIDSILSDWD